MTRHDDAVAFARLPRLHFHTRQQGIMGSDPFLPMNVTTKKSECDPKQRIRQLEVAIEHAQTAARASNGVVDGLIPCSVEIRYPSFEFRDTLKRLQPNAGIDGAWIVIDLGQSTAEACRAACTVLGHYYPEEQFVPSPVPVAR